MAEVTKDIPDLRGLVDQRAEQLIHDAFQRVYEFFERKIAILEAANKKLLEQQAANFQQTTNLVNGIFATPLIGGAATNPLTSIGVGNGTVQEITAGNGLSGGIITQSGVIALIVGSTNNLQKSNGSQLVDSQITDDGSTIIFIPLVGQIFNAGGADPSGLAYQNDQTFIGDWNGAGNGTFLEIKDAANGLFVFHNLPVADPGISGAVWNNGGVLNVSP